MADAQLSEEIETLAKMAARAAGRRPDERVRIVLGEIIAFDDVAWRYPDFLDRAELAHAMLTDALHAQALRGHVSGQVEMKVERTEIADNAQPLPTIEPDVSRVPADKPVFGKRL